LILGYSLYFIVLLCAFLIGWPCSAFSRKLEEQPVRQRIQPGYETQPHHVGSLELFPSARLMALFNDNIYASKNNTRSDLITKVSPGVVVHTSNPHHGFKAAASSEHGLYSQFDRENYNDFHLDFQPYVRITPSSKLIGKLAFDQEHDARTAEAASNNIGAEEPVQWQRSIGRIGWNYQPSRLAIQVFLQNESRRYENVASITGTQLINNDRNRNENSLNAEMSYDLGNQNKLYLTTIAFKRNYTRADFNTLLGSYSGINRDSDGYQTVIGVSQEITPLIRMNINGGIFHQSFNDGRLKTIQTPIGQAEITWQINPLTTIDLNLKRSVFETIQPDAAGFVQSKAGIEINHEFRRDLIIGGQLVTGSNNYAGSNRVDHYQGGGPFLIYKMNRTVSWKADVLYDKRNSNQVFADYTRQQAMITMQVQF
jgi:hypothetical protein